MTLAVVLCVLALAGFGVWVYLKSHAQKLLGPVDLTVTPNELCIGEALDYRLALSPTGRLQVNAVTLRCHGYEWIMWTEQQRSTNSKGRSTTRTVTRTRTHDLYDESHVLTENQTLTGAAVTLDGRFELPELPPSMEADNNAIRYKLRLHIDISGLPDFTEEYDFHVVPARRG
jgi:hypothetical protein